ncbi:MAG: hypothetical protein HQK76_20765 [Desulfobacterales bacterium]|nr:hypothetical protein [Desulfobacterales bacterium]
MSSDNFFNTNGKIYEIDMNISTKYLYYSGIVIGVITGIGILYFLLNLMFLEMIVILILLGVSTVGWIVYSWT